MPSPPEERLHLPTVTLCAVSSVNVEATLEAMETCLKYVKFADAVFFTDRSLPASQAHDERPIRLVEIEELVSARAYSQFILKRLVERIATDHCLMVQWDGHIIDPGRWRPEFLDYDYIGASWPQFSDVHNVGNGGFSLRSRRLMELCNEPDFDVHHPEDMAIGRTNRVWLERRGMRFAPTELADAFAAERASDASLAFGYHGVFLMPRVLGADRFWAIYRNLDDRSSVRHDILTVVKALQSGKNPISRSLQVVANQAFLKFARRKR